MAASRHSLPQVIGRYALYGEIAAGGMATVHYGRLLGPAGFARSVAIKRLHAQFAKDPEFVSMFLDEARLAARIRHPNVVPTLDVVALEGELFLVMEYVQGESLARLLQATRTVKQAIPLPVVSAVVCAMLHGLHAAHEATNERGEPLNIVHRDVSPHNVLVGADGITRVLDFGVAKATGRIHTTREGQVKGKLAYMAPEQLVGHGVDRRADIYAAGVVLWETLTRRRLFVADSEGATVAAVLNRKVNPPSATADDVPQALDAVTMRALDREPSSRFASAREMARALEECVPVASGTRLIEWVENLAGEVLAQRARALARMECDSETEGGSSPSTSTSTSTSTRHEPSPSTSTRTTVDPGLSQVSNLSLSTSAVRRQIVPSRHRRWWPVAAACLGALMLAMLAVAVMRAPARPAPAASGQPVPTQGLRSPPVPPSAALADVPPPPSEQQPQASVVPPSTARAPTTKPPPLRPAPTRAACDPPYVIDANGVRVPKRQCF